MLEVGVRVRRRDVGYPVLVGSFSLREAAAEIERRLGADAHVAVVDERVARLHDAGGAFGNRSGWRFLTVRAGEEGKTPERYLALCGEILAGGVDRRTVLVAVGGGVTGDLAGFAAATLLRGIRLVQMPTTLLAQVDSSVGGKTGVNMAGGKNLLGAFHQPELVIAGIDFLKTLPEREYRSGLAEVAKYGVLGDRNFFLRLEGEAERIAARDGGTLAGIVAHCCRMKAAIAGGDETESGSRRLLNLGHTFGHALEALAGYDGTLTHGEAVSLGTVLAAEYAREEGLLAKGEMELLLRGFGALGLPAKLDEIGDAAKTVRSRLRGDELAGALMKDKKAAAGGLTLVLPEAIGSCRIAAGVPAERVAAFMRRCSKNTFP